ncbi:Mut7-C RNAse domain-containing protein [Thermodesulfobacteriota bacterium]
MTRETRFAADRSLGKLAKWLRLLGYDTVYDAKITDADFLALAAEGRVLLTRTSRFIGRVPDRTLLWVSGNDSREQLRHVVKTAGLGMGGDRLFSRCLRCNRIVVPAHRENVASKIPDYIFAVHARFAQCPQCRRIYWRGTHAERSRRVLDSLLPGAEDI